jgi:hypothetical protein
MWLQLSWASVQRSAGETTWSIPQLVCSLRVCPNGLRGAMKSILVSARLPGSLSTALFATQGRHRQKKGFAAAELWMRTQWRLRGTTLLGAPHAEKWELASQKIIACTSS